MTHTEPRKSNSNHQYCTCRSCAKTRARAHSSRALEDDADSSRTGNTKPAKSAARVQHHPASLCKKEQPISSSTHSATSRTCSCTANTSWPRPPPRSYDASQASIALADGEVQLPDMFADQRTSRGKHVSKLEGISAEIWRSENVYRAATIGVQHARIAYFNAVNHAQKAGTILQAAQQNVLARSKTAQNILPPSPSPNNHENIALLPTHGCKSSSDTNVQERLTVSRELQASPDHQHEAAAATMPLTTYDCMKIGTRNAAQPGLQPVSNASSCNSLPGALSATQLQSCTSDPPPKNQLLTSHKRKASWSQLCEGGGDQSNQTHMPPDAVPENDPPRPYCPQSARAMVTERSTARPGNTDQNASSLPASEMPPRTLPTMHGVRPYHLRSLEQQKNWLQQQLSQQKSLPARWQYQGYLRRPVPSPSAARATEQAQPPVRQPPEQPVRQQAARIGVPIELIFADTDPHLVPERYVLMLDEGQVMAARQAAVHHAHLLLTRRILAAENLQAHATPATPMPTTPHSNLPQRQPFSASLQRESGSE